LTDIELKKTELLEELEIKRLESEIRRTESTSNSKEVASKYIGKSAIPWIVLLVVVGVVSSKFLPTESRPNRDWFSIHRA
jgi:hypothetical protein